MRRERAAYIVHCCNTLPTVAKERDEAVALLEQICAAHKFDGSPMAQAKRWLINRLRG